MACVPICGTHRGNRASNTHEENKANWDKVRVFDSELKGYEAGKK